MHKGNMSPRVTPRTTASTVGSHWGVLKGCLQMAPHWPLEQCFCMRLPLRMQGKGGGSWVPVCSSVYTGMSMGWEGSQRDLTPNHRRVSLGPGGVIMVRCQWRLNWRQSTRLRA